ncbi:MAG: transporter substrate-binding domain-containing protein [Cyanobacteria bacterium P01_D01_bin.1]
MKRRWFLAGLTLPFVSAGCRASSRSDLAAPDAAEAATEAASEAAPKAVRGDIKVVRNSKTLVMATTPNYPPYQQLEADPAAGDADTPESSDLESSDIVGFDIDIANLVAARLGRQLTVVNLPFDDLIPALTEDKVDMVMAALAPSRSRKQLVDFSNIYYRSRHALVSIEGYLRSRDLSYQTIGVHTHSVQARFAQKLVNGEIPSLTIESYGSLSQLFEAVDIGEVAGAIVEANVANDYTQRYADLEANIIPTENPTGSAIALPKSSPLLRDINAALSDIKASGEMDQLIDRWFG